ncbi:MAG: hypothetical protein AAF228_13065 [Pseudomonadota bacterium]
MNWIKNLRAWKNISRLDPKRAGNLWNYGLALIHTEKYQSAVEVLSKGVELSPRYGEIYTLRAIAYEELGAFHKALADLKKAQPLLLSKINQSAIMSRIANIRANIKKREQAALH